MAAEYKPEDKNQVKPKKDEPAPPSGGKPATDIKQRTQKELEAGKRALERHRAETTKSE